MIETNSGQQKVLRGLNFTAFSPLFAQQLEVLLGISNIGR